MKTKLSIKLVKKVDRRAAQKRGVRGRLADGPDRWSVAVRSWVAEFQQRDRVEALPAFDSLFKRTLPAPGRLD